MLWRGRLRKPLGSVLVLTNLLFLCDCASSRGGNSRLTDPIPLSLLEEVDRQVSFVQVKEASASYQGRLIVLGGEVLSAKRLAGSTRIEVLQLPLTETLEPYLSRTSSQGRFLGYQKKFLDPATIPPGTRLTVLGMVTGSSTEPLDETEYTYPVLEITYLKVWTELKPPSTRSNVYSYTERYGTELYGSPYADPYWYSYQWPFWGWFGIPRLFVQPRLVDPPPPVTMQPQSPSPPAPAIPPKVTAQPKPPGPPSMPPQANAPPTVPLQPRSMSPQVSAPPKLIAPPARSFPPQIRSKRR